MMAKPKKKIKKHHRSSIMNRSDIPYAQRMAMQHRGAIIANREHAAKTIMYCVCCALHKSEGIGYKRLVRYSIRFKTVLDEIYEDIEVGMAHAKQRLASHGIDISGDLYTMPIPGASAKEQNIQDHAMQAMQIAQLAATVTMNDEFGLGEMRLNRVLEMVNRMAARYAKEGEAFLLAEMEKIGFLIIDGSASCFMDDDGNPITAARAIKEGYLNGVCKES